MTTIFTWRVEERLGYKAIADRLNTDLNRYPPPSPVDPSRAVGRWTPSSVREVLTNPKHTGYMVWNRRATKSAGGKQNPPQAWVWSSVPTHEPLVTKEIFIDAQKIAAFRKGSRNGASPNTAHPDTKRTYVLRSYMTCAWCEHRMRGRHRHQTLYYVCDPAKEYAPQGHPRAFWVREDLLMDGLTDFFAVNIFGPHRHNHLDAMLTKVQERAVNEHQARLDAVRAGIEEIEDRRRRLIQNLELLDGDTDLMNDIRRRSAELSNDRNNRIEQLEKLEHQTPARPRPELLDLLPAGPIRLDVIPEALQRKLFEAFRLQIRYDCRTDLAHAQVTLTATTIQAQQQTAEEALTTGAAHGHDGASAPMLCVPPTGFEPALPP